MKLIATMTVACAAILPAHAETENFDKTKPSGLPPGWEAGVTGSGAPRWAVDVEPSAPSAPHVLQQIGQGEFPWAVKKDASLADGFVEVKFKAVRGKQDQAGGLVWRWKDLNNYYVARANALENNVSLYYTANGRRNTIKYVDAPVAGGTWHTLRVEFSGKRIKVMLNGKTYIELDDGRIAGAGAVGVWTKADSVTYFDDFAYGATASRRIRTGGVFAKLWSPYGKDHCPAATFRRLFNSRSLSIAAIRERLLRAACFAAKGASRDGAAGMRKPMP
jgi:hypothetical protein